MPEDRPNIVLAGQGTWCELVATGLLEHAGLTVGVATFDRVGDAFKAERWSSLLHARLVVRVGFRPGARTWRGRVLDFALHLVRAAQPGQRTAYYWIGSDVMRLVADADARRWPWWLAKELAGASHIAIAAPLAAELKRIGIAARVMPIPFRGMPAGDDVPPLPDRFTVLTYIPDFRADFYGSETVLEAARRLPDVHFVVMGGEGDPSRATPDNVEYVGWQDDPGARITAASCVVRLVEHDGAGGTVLEALSWGRSAIYSREDEHVIHVPFGDAEKLTSAIGQLYEQHRAGTLVPNSELAREIRRRYAPEACYRPFAEWLTATAEEAAL